MIAYGAHFRLIARGLADYLAGAVLNMLTWWLDNNMPCSPEQMDVLFKQLVQPGVEATLGIEVIQKTPT